MFALNVVPSDKAVQVNAFQEFRPHPENDSYSTYLCGYYPAFVLYSLYFHGIKLPPLPIYYFSSSYQKHYLFIFGKLQQKLPCFHCYVSRSLGFLGGPVAYVPAPVIPMTPPPTTPPRPVYYIPEVKKEEEEESK